MKRRSVLAGLAGGAGIGLAAPALAQAARRLRMITDRSEDGTRLAERIARLSDGRVTLDLSVRPAEEAAGFREAVGDGSADLYLASDAAFVADDPALMLFSAMPGGMASQEMEAWIYVSSGAAVWDRIGQAANVTSFLAGDTGPMPIWSREPITSIASIQGPIASMGAGLLAWERMGVSPVALGADMTEAFGIEGLSVQEIVERDLHQTFPYLCAPSAGLPSSAITLGVNRDLVAELGESGALLIERCAAAHNGQVRSQAAYRNAQAFTAISSDVTLLDEAPELWQAQMEAGRALLEDMQGLDESRAGAVESYLLFLRDVAGWSDIGEASYFEGRKRILSDLL
ncbi:hypothetical protein AAD018_013670 [Aestuariibius insulae]|uniref:hypothetical protein n=1 Tax=Aestuariibius insulae TaxID=2058287 RepID=UPI00345EDE4F